MGFFIILFLCLNLRLFFIQILKGEDYAKRATIQRSSKFFAENRGDIFDKNGNSLTGRYYTDAIIISPQWLSEKERKILHNLDLFDYKSFRPYEIESNAEQVDKVKVLSQNSPGVLIYRKQNQYGPRALATHVVGYKSETGVEKTFDSFLRTDFLQQGIICDGLGQPIKGIAKAQETPAWGIKLTLDKNIQEVVEKIMDKAIYKGAIVILDAKSGDILAMASRPNYKQYKIEDYLDRKDAPLINRAVRSYTPGSIFKIIILSAVLEEGKAELESKYYCPGFIKVGENLIKCSSFEKGGHGELTLEEAMAHSCNTVFIKLGLELGKEKIMEYAKAFGLGEKVCIGIPEEESGFLPELDNIFFQDISNLSLGQGPIEISPLQAAQVLLFVANNGNPPTVSLFKEKIDSFGNAEKIANNKKSKVRAITSATADKVMKALVAVAQYGTGYKSTPDLPYGYAAGKTGTAEVHNKKAHAWFVACYPSNDPEYIISIFIEEGGAGSQIASPVFKELIEKLYQSH